MFKAHYFLTSAGANALGLLLGVFFGQYTDASSTEIGFIYMLMPLCAIIFRPILCSLADQRRAHRRFMIGLLLATALCYLPFILIPALGPVAYRDHPRLCWWAFLVPKVAGDIAFNGVVSIGDTLAINYAHRINADYTSFRRWDTISWLIFGAITGQINEVWFLPKYVPAFIILISASLINASLFWIWPDEYFVMVSRSDALKTTTPDKTEAKPKILLSNAELWAHMKRKLCLLNKSSELKANKCDQLAQVVVASDNQGAAEPTSDHIDRTTQLKILLLLLKRDSRILLYALVLVFAGLSIAPISFFCMHLCELCHSTGRCDYSQLVGLLQGSISVGELITFYYIKRTLDTIGRLNTFSIGFALASLKYTFYAIIWPSVNPYFALLTEVPHGLMYGIYSTLMVELGYFFSGEVELLIPELVECQIVPSAADPATCERLKMSLAATMQAIMSGSIEGFGKGLGALLYGYLLDLYSFPTLAYMLSLGGALVLAGLQAVRLLDACLQLDSGFNQKFSKHMEAANSVKGAEAGLAKHQCKPAKAGAALKTIQQVA